MEGVRGLVTTHIAILSGNSTNADATDDRVATEISTVSDFSTQETSDYSGTDTNNSYNDYGYDYGDEYGYDYGDVYMYPGYDFERSLYLYIWEIIVVIIFLVNLIVISVLLRRKMRNATNIILAAIAVSDSLTGLVTLPAYILVYQKYDPLLYEYEYSQYNTANTSFNLDNDNLSYYATDANVLTSNRSGQGGTTIITDSWLTSENPSYQSVPNDYPPQDPVDGYILTKDLCRGYMISKYFLSKSFHTVSIFLTLFLAIQRYVSVAFPYKSQFLFNIKRTIVCIVVIFTLSPLLHTYHLTGDKAMDGLCQWELQEQGCGGTCIYLWIAFFVRHFLPCVTLVVLSVLFILHLRLGEKHLRRMDSNSSQISRRAEENRRISIIVMAIVAVFLIPEIPYGIFLLYNAVEKTANDGKAIQLKTNRAIQLAYEVALVLSFHANVYIYILFNKRFRKVLYRTIVKPVRRLVTDPRRLSITRTSSTSHAGSTRKTAYPSSKTQHDVRCVHTYDSEKSSGMETKTMQTFTSEKSQDAVELEPLNSKT